ncbi:phage tail fiber protein [Desulfovibrio inopinatus]|uniref:phage tail fiber protein n=1 Tax=Desulfovibrio inopinatus TaxID=102109 RepID=UPI00041DE733|nr:hypothetical protein [Desulfovibrio inopinatus]
MSAMSNYLEQSLINAILRATAFSSPNVADLHLALFVADPTDANITTNEVSASWYERQPTGTWTAPGAESGQSSNTSSVTFPAVSGDSVTITHFGIYDSSLSGNLLLHGPLTTPKTMDDADVVSFAPGSLVVTMA